MFLKKLIVGEIQANCYVVGSAKGSEAIVIDPGAEGEKILSVTEENDLKIKYIVNTHGHIDHTGADAFLLENIVPRPLLCVHKDDAAMLSSGELSLASSLGLKTKPLSADILLKDGDSIEIYGMSLKVIHTPGHTPGGISLLTDGILFTGDTLFSGGIGRTDLPGGSATVLMNSIHEKLLVLENTVVICPGHGDDSELGREKQWFTG